jgi:hypothetical protein
VNVTLAGLAVAAAEAEAVSVTVLVPAPGDGKMAAENPAVTPEGNPEAVNATAAWNPPVGATVSVTWPVAPCWRVSEI